MQKEKKLDWKDTNLEFIGSDIDRKVKKESAQTEKAWEKVAACKEPALFVWRVEQFKIVEWPRDKYGKFYSGDSYIVLNVYKEKGSNQLLYDAHFWIGQHSTADEYGTAAYKTVELDTFLDDRAIQHREVEQYESKLFKSYFPTITYMKGGCPSGFRHVETRETHEPVIPHLFHFCGLKSNVVVKEVMPSKKMLDSNDVYILDLGHIAYQWNGNGATKDERFRAAIYLRQLSNDRCGKVKTEVLDENQLTQGHEFYSKLTEEDTNESCNASPEETFSMKLFKLSDETGEIVFTCVAEVKISREDITEDDVFIIDNGENIFVYVGERASPSERKNALVYAHNYLKSTNHPCIPVTVAGVKIAGPSRREFDRVFAA